MLYLWVVLRSLYHHSSPCRVGKNAAMHDQSCVVVVSLQSQHVVVHQLFLLTLMLNEIEPAVKAQLNSRQATFLTLKNEYLLKLCASHERGTCLSYTHPLLAVTVQLTEKIVITEALPVCDFLICS